MKTKRETETKNRAFTLIEMIGVLAVIAILAALLIPKIFEAINNARINNAVVSYNTVKAAVMDYYGKNGTLLAGGSGLTVPVPDYDAQVLLREGLTDKPFRVRVGTNSTVQVVAGETAGGVTANNAGYWLSGSGGSAVNEAANAAHVVQAVIFGVAAADARAINDALDGTELGAPLGSEDLKGRVKFGAIAAGSLGTVYIYVAHR